MEFKDIKALVERAEQRGTVITKAHPCGKCGNQFYYTRAGRKCNNCLWCAYTKQDLPKRITEVTRRLPDNTLVYSGKACRNCGCTDHLAEKAHGAKERACYQCAVAKASSKGATHQQNRLRQQIKHQTFAFVVNSIARSDSVEIAPRNWSEHWLVMALHEDCKRLNQLEAMQHTGVTWQVGHRYPASGGGTEYRGKATVENLYLVRTEQNRSDKDSLPEHWNSKQVVWIGDVYDTISSREAAAGYRHRLGLDSLTKEQIQQQKQRENEQNARHYTEVKRLSADVVDSINLALSGEADYQALRDMVTLRIEKIDQQAAARIRTARKKRESIFNTDGGIIEEGLHGAKARYRIILNTIEQFEDIEQERRHRLKSPADIGTLNTQTSLIKRALLYWARDVLRSPKRDIDGFTHPLLDGIADPATWGIKQGADGKMWLCGWKYENGEPVPLDVRAERNAEYITMDARRFIQREQERKAAVTSRLQHMVSNARAYTATSKALAYSEPVPVPENIFDTEEIKQRQEIGRRLMLDKAQQQEKAVELLRERMNEWHRITSKGIYSADDTEKQSQQWIERLSPYQNEPKAPAIYNYDIEQALIAEIQQENPPY
ncbi:hypothetical protein E2019_22980 [Salmonella enterica subsp. enterica serovar Amager]|nr:hypothetical protein [Salmonella enterica subsp. enterica serovar Amager]ECF3422719.1 hypothetical protein [Salmonella enterica subsp. enterica serovar Amager]